jgi:hypothetical protein
MTDDEGKKDQPAKPPEKPPEVPPVLPDTIVIFTKSLDKLETRSGKVGKE